MFRWLNGPGAVFRHALPGSTNYINAYDRSGNLLRAIDSSALGKNQQDEDEENGAEADDEEAEEGEFKATRKEKARKPPRKETTEGTPLPKENLEDLMPFPLNRQFRSQPVLSEELKDEIWKRIMEEGKSIRDVSATLGVEMNRVGAVVRLKGVEREWEKQVCEACEKTFAHLAKSLRIQMMRENISISLEDYHHGYQNNYNSLILYLCPFVLSISTPRRFSELIS